MSNELNEIKKLIKEELIKKKSILLEAPAGDDHENFKGNTDATVNARAPSDDNVFTNSPSPAKVKEPSLIPSPEDPDNNIKTDPKYQAGFQAGFMEYNALLVSANVEIQKMRGELASVVQKLTEQAIESFQPSENSLMQQDKPQISPVDLSNLIKLSMNHGFQRVFRAAKEKIQRS